MAIGGIKRESKIAMIPVIQITTNKFQPRRSCSAESLRSLTMSIEQNGIIQPLTVRQTDYFEYELITGERRLRAAVRAGMSEVPCIIFSCSEEQSAVYSLVENVQRENLNSFEKSRALRMLSEEFALSDSNAAKTTGIKERRISELGGFLKFTYEEEKMINKSGLSEKQALTVLKLEDPNIRRIVLSKVVENGLNEAQTDMLVNKVLSPEFARKSSCSPTIVIKDLRPFFNTVNKALKTIRMSGINAVDEKIETDDYIEYKIRIEK